MTERTLTVKTPGKLMVAGEFAVLEPNYHLITMAVDRFVYITIEQTLQNILNLIDYQLTNIKWDFAGTSVSINCRDERLSFVKEAIKITYTYLHEKGITPKPCTISVKSELADESGIKYGLGSSAAVVTGIVTAILNKNVITPEKELIFKLAALAHINVQGNGSGADIAASTYCGMVLYTSFQAEWLINEYEKSNSISSLVEKKWTYLSIKQLDFPSQFHMKIGWTGSPASTRSLVSDVNQLKVTNKLQYDTFLQCSEQAVSEITHSIETRDFTSFLNGIRKNRQALEQLGQHAHVDIETEKLHLLSMLAEEHEGAGKLSGAGGGDCGIAFVPTEELGEKLAQVWEKHGIKPLDLTLYK